MKVNVVFTLFFIGIVTCALSQSPEWLRDQSVYTTVIDSVIDYFESEGFYENDLQILHDKGSILILKDNPPFKRGLQVSLQNIYLDYLNNNTSPIAYLSQLKTKLLDERNIVEDMKSFDSVKKYLKIRIYPNKYSNENALIYNCNITSLDGTLCLETDYGIKDVLSSEIERWNVDRQKVIQEALDQTKLAFSSNTFVGMEVASGIPAHFYFDDKNYFVSSILMFPELFKNFDEGNGVLVCIPTRHCALIVPLKSDDIDDILIPVLGVNHEIYSNQPGRVTLDFFHFKDGHYSVIHPLIDEENKKIDFIRRN